MMSDTSPSNSITNQQSDEIDLAQLFGIIADDRWQIALIVFLFALFSIIYVLFATPIYKADALIQVEQKASGMSVLGEMGDLFSSESSATTEIELLTSRMILGKTVDNLNLSIIATPNYFPLFGKGWARIQKQQHSIHITRFNVPSDGYGSPYQLIVNDPSLKTYTLYDEDDKKVLQGEVGKLAKSNNTEVFVVDMDAKEGDSFTLVKQSRFDAIQQLKERFSVSENGKQTGILTLSLMDENSFKSEAILNDISKNYFLQNVERNSKEASNSLEFLKTHIPDVKKNLNTSEEKLNSYQRENESVDLDLEAKSVLDVMVKLEAQLNELTFKESEISQRFAKNHPAYIALMDKRNTLLKEKKRIYNQIEKMPITQQEVLRLRRDVEVNQEIYVQLLNKIQELSILKASTVGNVRIVDLAQSYSNPVKPKKALIVVLAILLGGMVGVAYSLLKAAWSRGIAHPDEVEKIGLSVYTCIPLSKDQEVLGKKVNQGEHTLFPMEEILLALANPADLSIESLRGLRTSLHFLMSNAHNNIIMLSGPSPGVGKSFVSSNMAAVIAQSGQKVLLIDGDMRKGYMQRYMAVKSSHGLSNYLTGDIEIDSVVHHTALKNLDFISRGDIPPNPSELLMSDNFRKMMDWANGNYDLVLIDTPPILAVTDAAIIGAHAATNLIVGRFGTSRLKEVEITRQRFKQAGINLRGFILNGVVKNATSEVSYYHYDYK